jgi:hypothetical protein
VAQQSLNSDALASIAMLVQDPGSEIGNIWKESGEKYLSHSEIPY